MPELIIASYNIHRCIGTDGQYQPSRIRQVLYDINPHIIALQEVESGAQHGELLEYFTQAKGWTFVEGPALLRGEARYGNAVLTSLPVIKHRLVELSYRSREPRGAIELYLQYEDKVVRVIATHLGLSASERRYQAGILLKLISDHGSMSPAVTLLLGDLNEWLPWSRTLRLLRRPFGGSPSPVCYPTRWPLLSLDRVFIQPPERLHNIQAWRNTLTHHASDHYPLVASIDI